MNQIKIIFLLMIFSSTLGYAQIGRLALSPLQKIEQNIARTDITIEYCRPSKKGRDIFGELVPYNEYWRTGANRNTIITFSEDVIIDNQRIKKGKYSIITKPSRKIWEFLLYTETNNWDVPEQLDSSKISCRTIVESKKLSNTIESLNISIGDFNNYEFNLEIEWDQTHLTIPISLTTKEKMARIIKDELDGPSAGDYYSAAVYQLESEKNYKQGLDWINQAIKIRSEPVWYDLRVKALLLLELNNLNEIEKIVFQGYQLAQKNQSDYGIKEFDRIKKRLDF